MKRGLILLLSFLFTFVHAQAFELVLPTEKKAIVNTKYAFFVGKAKPSEILSINGENIYIAPNGAFAHSIKLKDGENRILLRSNYGTQVYKLYRNSITPQTEPALFEFDIKKAIVNCDNTPLRSTPVDGGLNRMGHLYAGTQILINGTKGDFYRVFLSDKKTGWIMKKDVNLVDFDSLEPAEFVSMKSERFKNAASKTIEFTKNLPYTIEDNSKEIVLRVYNPEFSPDSVYNLTLPKPKKYKYSVALENGTYTFKVREIPQKIEDCTIAIDAGHGGYERGAIGCLGDEEKTINLKIAEQLAEKLKTAGANVVMTRICDGFTSLGDRVAIASENDADIFVSIHLNSIGDIPMNIHKNRGTSVYYYNDNSKELAEAVEKEVTSLANTRNDGVRTASFAVIRPTNYVGILVETAYMTNPHDSVLYRENDFPEKAAEGILKGIKEFIKK